MMPPARLIAIGMFVIGGSLLFALALFLIGDRRFMFAQHVDVHAEFATVAGLRAGAAVRVSGMDAGEVTDIAIPSSPAGRFRVRMQVREDLQQLVRQDSVASIQTDGIVGNRFVQIAAGSSDAAVAADEGFIASREPFDFGELLAQSGQTIATVNATIVQLRTQLDHVLTTVGETAAHANGMIAAASSDVEAMTRAGRRISDDASRIVEGVRAGRGTVGKLMNDDELYTRANRIAQQAEDTMRLARQAAEGAQTAVARLQTGLSPNEGAVGALMSDLRHTVASARESMSNLAENTEALKRNVLFRGFFRERGFYDLGELTAANYRQGALAGDHREPIRIWLRSDVVFEAAISRLPVAGVDGSAPLVEALSADGRTRIDRAMAEVLRYPRNTPLIIEGYAPGDTRDERLLRAAERARQVRDYVIARYALAPTHVGALPLGSEAEGSPDGTEWDGIALAVWIDRRVLLSADPK